MYAAKMDSTALPNFAELAKFHLRIVLHRLLIIVLHLLLPDALRNLRLHLLVRTAQSSASARVQTFESLDLPRRRSGASKSAVVYAFGVQQSDGSPTEHNVRTH